MQQLSLTFESGLAAHSPTLRDHLAMRIYARGLVAMAGQMDLSPSKMTEKLAGADSGGKPRGITIDELERYIDKTGDLSPVYYLADKYLRDPELTRQEAMAKIAAMADLLPGLMATAGLAAAPKRGR